MWKCQWRYYPTPPQPTPPFPRLPDVDLCDGNESVGTHMPFKKTRSSGATSMSHWGKVCSRQTTFNWLRHDRTIGIYLNPPCRFDIPQFVLAFVRRLKQQNVHLLHAQHRLHSLFSDHFLLCVWLWPVWSGAWKMSAWKIWEGTLFRDVSGFPKVGQSFQSLGSWLLSHPNRGVFCPTSPTHG